MERLVNDGVSAVIAVWEYLQAHPTGCAAVVIGAIAFSGARKFYRLLSTPAEAFVAIDRRVTPQREITSPVELLNPTVRGVTDGWARHPHWRYAREAALKCNVPGWRIKEWDYYAILSADGSFGITFTISDLGYLGMSGVCFLDFKSGKCSQIGQLSLLPMGRTRCPADSRAGTIGFRHKNVTLDVHTDGRIRKLRFSCPGLSDCTGRTGAEGEITLTELPDRHESVNTVNSWTKCHHFFFYTRKLNCMRASGEFKIGDKTFTFNPSRDFAVLDWGRGYWPYKNRWYWASASGVITGTDGKQHVAGWNLGNNLCDRTPGNDNAVVYDGVVHKLGEVSFHLDPADFMKPWRFTSDDDRFEMNFVPILDRQSGTDFLVIKSVGHQVFGYYTGHFVLDDGRDVSISRMLGFAEDIVNWW